MTVQSNSNIISKFQSISRVSSIIVVFIGIIVLLGWIFDITTFKRLLPHLQNMKLNTALSLIMSGTSLLLLQNNREKLITQICAVVVLLIGILTLSEHIFNINLGIDELILKDTKIPIEYNPGRMSPHTAVNFILIGVSLLLIDFKISRFYPSQLFSIFAFLISFISLMGYAYNIKALYSISPFTVIALHTAIGFIFISIGILSARPENGIMRVVSSNSIGGFIARRLLPISIILPFVLGYIRLKGQRAGLYSTEFGILLLVLSSIFIFVPIIYWYAERLDKIDEEKKRFEKQLQHMQKIETIGQLTGGIAHDFNNLLTAIILSANIMKMRIENNPELMAFLQQILSTADRAANLTKSLLTFSRKQVLDKKPVSLNEIIKNVEKLLTRIIGEDIEFKIKLSERDVVLMADSGQIEQVLMNLASNARDAMAEGGELTIDTQLINLDEEYVKAHVFSKAGMYALITVTDTGTGMDEATQSKIFEPFFTTKGVGKGTGLGLSIVYGIIKQHDGYINVYSEPGRGASFKIYLPIIESEIEVAKEKETIPPKGGSETILIAEDEAKLRGLAKSLLTGYGYKVIEAVDGEDAIEKFNENRDRIQLYILDVIMPKKNGKDVYDEIMKTRPDIKALFLSGYNEEVIHKKGILEEGLNFISKPFAPTNFLRKVREVLDK